MSLKSKVDSVAVWTSTEYEIISELNIRNSCMRKKFRNVYCVYIRQFLISYKNASSLIKY